MGRKSKMTEEKDQMTLAQLKRERSSLQDEVSELCVDLDELLQGNLNIDTKVVINMMSDIDRNHMSHKDMCCALTERLSAEGQDSSYLEKRQKTVDKIVQACVKRAQEALKVHTSKQIEGENERRKREMKCEAEKLQQQLSALNTAMAALDTKDTLVQTNSHHTDSVSLNSSSIYRTQSPDTTVSFQSATQNVGSQERSPQIDDCDQVKTLLKYISHAALDMPKPELLTFNGDQQMYTKFICCFDTNVANKPIDGDAKLNYLIQLCQGEAKRIVDPYVFIRGEKGYMQAREALDKRYGKKHKVLRAHIETLTKGKPLRVGCKGDLFRFLEDLNITQVTLESMGRAGELDTNDTMQKLVLRLPIGLRHKWVSKSVQILKAKGREGCFSEFRSFLEDISEEYDSMYSAEALGEEVGKHKDRSPPNKDRSVNYTSQTNKACVQCGNGCRAVEDCPEFKKLNVRQRLAAVRTHQLCLFCLKAGHMVRACRKASKCTVPNCKFTHHNLLHEWASGSQNEIQSGPLSNSGGVHCTSVESQGRNYKVSIAIVPVTVRGIGGKLVDTFALLDSGSDISLVDQELLKELNIKGKQQSYSITTVNQTESIQHGMEVYLDVKSYYGGRFTRINRMWSVRKLPVSLNGLPQSEELSMFPHLKGIKIPKVNGKKVGMLIGSDMPDLVCPYQVRRGNAGQPWAMRCKLGWAVMGKFPVSNNNCQNTEGQTHFISSQYNVPGQLDSADLTSRGLLAKEAGKCNVWLNEPKLLLDSEDKWPCSDTQLEADESDLEVSSSMNVNVVTTAPIGCNVLWERYSSFLKLKKVCAWCLRFKHNLMAKCSLRGKTVLQGDLTVLELELAETAVVQAVQNEVYSDEITRLQNGRLVKLSSSIAKLKPRLLDGVLRISSRTDTPVEVGPILLPGKHAIAKLIIRRAHIEVGHLGCNSTLVQVREKYWITKGISSVRHVLAKCMICKRQHARPVQQLMATLPKVRTTPDEPPFTNVGLDFFGPFSVRQRRSTVKRYGLILVCMSTRAVHIEITHSLETNSVLMGLSRFIARRGKPSSVYCDNGTSIVKADKVLTEELKVLQKSKLYKDCIEKGIEFIYRAPLCSYMGGVYERLIRSVRAILFALCRQQTLHDEGLITFMCTVEKILNGRPITQINSSVGDPKPLTPNMLLLLRSNEGVPEALCKQNDNYHQRRWAQIQYMSDVFWRRWVKEYLPSLHKRQKWLRETKAVKKGDLVLLQESNCPRGLWPLALVVDTQVSHDGLIRSCIVKKGKVELKRALSSICMLESC